MENYQFDEKIMNQGWSQMNDLLDKEMPVQKKRRVPFLWWWSAASLSVAAMLLLFFNVTNFKNKENNNTISKNIDVEEKQEIIKQSDTPTNQIESNKNVFLEEKNISNQVFLEKKPLLAKEQSYNVENSNSLQPKSPLLIEHTEENLNTTGSTSQEKQNVETKRLSEQREKISVASLSLLDQKIIPIEINEKEKNIFLEKNIKKINYLQANNLKIGIFASATNGFNFGTTIKKTWKRHSLSANLFGEFSSKNLGIYTSAIPVADANSMPTYPVVFPYGDINLAKDNSGTYQTNLVSDYYFSLKTRNLGIGIEHNYRIKNRWESILGFEYLKEVGNRSYTYAQVQNSSSKLLKSNSEISTFAPTGNITNTLKYDYSADGLKTQDDLQNIDVNKNVSYFTTGFSYYFGKKLKFSAIYKQGLNSVIVTTPIKVMVTNNNVAFRLTYYLPLKK